MFLQTLLTRPLQSEPLTQHPGQGLPNVLRDLRIADISAISSESGHHPHNVAVHRRNRNVEGDRSNCAGCIRSDPGELLQLLIVRRQLACILFLHNKRSLFQIPRSAVIAQAFPQLQEPVIAAVRQRRNVRQRLQKTLIVRLHRLHTRLLQHDLRNPHMIRRRIRPPRKVPVASPKPGCQLLGQGTVLCPTFHWREGVPFCFTFSSREDVLLCFIFRWRQNESLQFLRPALICYLLDFFKVGHLSRPRPIFTRLIFENGTQNRPLSHFTGRGGGAASG